MYALEKIHCAETKRFVIAISAYRRGCSCIVKLEYCSRPRPLVAAYFCRTCTLAKAMKLLKIYHSLSFKRLLRPYSLLAELLTGAAYCAENTEI